MHWDGGKSSVPARESCRDALGKLVARLAVGRQSLLARSFAEAGIDDAPKLRQGRVREFLHAGKRVVRKGDDAIEAPQSISPRIVAHPQ